MRAADRQAVRPACLLDGSRMSREVHVRFCERLGVQLPGPTPLIVLHESSLRRTLKSYFEYYHRSRTHLSLGYERFSRQKWGRLCRCRKSVGYTTATNDGPPENSSSALHLLGR